MPIVSNISYIGAVTPDCVGASWVIRKCSLGYRKVGKKRAKWEGRIRQVLRASADRAGGGPK